MNIRIENLDIKELAEYIGAYLKEYDIEVVLVGGACVSIYTKNKYMSFDLDMITYEPMKKVRTVLAKIGFKYDKNKYFIHEGCKYFIEFVTPPVTVGDEPINIFNTLKSKIGEINILTPTDCVKDRLAAYIHWDDQQSLEQALWVAQSQKVDLDKIKNWASKEFNGDKIKRFLKKLDVLI